MVNKLTIKNYKSIKELNINAKRINIFIGENNSGKSNIIEALSWLSVNAFDNGVFRKLFRLKNATDLFYDFNSSVPIDIQTDKYSVIIRQARSASGMLLNHFEAISYNNKLESYINQVALNPHDYTDGNTTSGFTKIDLNFNGDINTTYGNLKTPFRTYIFKKLSHFTSGDIRPFLSPPFGGNIPFLLISNKEYKELISNLFKEKGFRLMLKPTENDLNMAKDVNDELYSYPYQSISETLQRIIFYTLAIKTNNDSILVFDEPESNTFPMYTKQLAELIALNTSNQYFLSTHDPYLLGSIVEKTPLSEIAVFVTKMKNYETCAEEVSVENLSKILDQGIDVFFNLDKLIE